MKTLSEYGRIFNLECLNWSTNPEYNLRFLEIQQSHLNDILKCRGHLMLNEAYDALGFPRTAKGAVIGWVYEEDNKIGDNFVDFGLEASEVDGPDIPVDFNVDGYILDRIGGSC